MDRRKFLQQSAASLIGLTIGGRFISAAELSSHGISLMASSSASNSSAPSDSVQNFGKPSSARRARKQSYNVVILGDTHYDAAPETVYHAGYSDSSPVREASHRKEFAQYAQMWQDRLPRLIKRAGCLVDDNTRIALQMGDMVQGDCGTQEAHAQMLKDAYTRISREFAPLPLVTVAGNHDVRGRSDEQARAAYEDFSCLQMTDALGRSVAKTTFGFWIGPDAYICIDFNQTDNAELEALISESKDARYTFVLTHGPVFPYESTANPGWILHGARSGASPETRRHFRKLLAQRNAIVLCGHTHTTEFIDWKGDGGRITQMIMNSVWKSEDLGTYRVAAEGADKYGTLAAAGLAKAGKVMKPELKAWFDEYAPGIRSYIHGKGAGSYRMKVGPDGVTVDFYAGDSTRPSASFKLR